MASYQLCFGSSEISRNDNIWCLQCRQNWHNDNFRFSVCLHLIVPTISLYFKVLGNWLWLCTYRKRYLLGLFPKSAPIHKTLKEIQRYLSVPQCTLMYNYSMFPHVSVLEPTVIIAPLYSMLNCLNAPCVGQLILTGLHAACLEVKGINRSHWLTFDCLVVWWIQWMNNYPADSSISCQRGLYTYTIGVT